MINQIIGFIGTLGTILLLGGYAPQIKKLITTKNADGISKSFWLILFSGITLLFINLTFGYYQNDMLSDPKAIINMVAQGGNAILALWTLILVNKYQK